MQAREYERAAVLAEKYVDFNALLTVCDETMNENRLGEYIDKLGDQGFTEFACKWSVKAATRWIDSFHSLPHQRPTPSSLSINMVVNRLPRHRQ